MRQGPVQPVLWRTLAVLTILLAMLSKTNGQGSDPCSDGPILCVNGVTCVPINGGNDPSCPCPAGYPGDGFRLGSGCSGYCLTDNDCIALAECIGTDCTCLNGYDGDGINCTNRNECQLDDPCHAKATCTDETPGFTCQCNSNYVGNGITCTFSCSPGSCTGANTKCDIPNCVCEDGFEDDGLTTEPEDLTCIDIDECLAPNACQANATCNNTMGSFTCTCNPGFELVGTDVCRKYPIDCDEFLLNNPGASSGMVTLDTDFDGPHEHTAVFCDFTTDCPKTVIRVDKDRFKANINLDITLDYDLDDSIIQDIIYNAGYCYQEFRFSSSTNAAIFPGTTFLGNLGVVSDKWPGATASNTCPCETVKGCQSCFCDGNNGGNNGPKACVDSGRETNRLNLPMKEIHYEKQAVGKGTIEVGDIYCSRKPCDNPIDCQDARDNFEITDTGPVIIDLDGELEECPPFLVLCDMSIRGVGVTVINHDGWEIDIVPPDVNKQLNYIANMTDIEKLLAKLDCNQKIELECQDLPLFDGNTLHGAFVGPNGTANYWGGGDHNPLPYSCDCGVLGTCDDQAKLCNCDILDGNERRDFGRISNNDDLPVLEINFASVTGPSVGKVKVGPLRCASVQIDIEPSCQAYRYLGYDYSYAYLIDPAGPEDPTEPFLVHCEMDPTLPLGCTHLPVQQLSNPPEWTFTYKANGSQIDDLKARSTDCKQQITYTCVTEPLFDGGSPLFDWGGHDQDDYSYFYGDNSNSNCYCTTCDPPTSTTTCNCVDPRPSSATDTGMITNKDALPLLWFDSSSDGVLQLGPLICCETFPNCADLAAQPRTSQQKVLRSPATRVIDVDGVLGFEPISVTCEEDVTQISPTNDTFTESAPDTDICQTFEYTGPSGDVIPPLVIAKLVEDSGSCRQPLYAECKNTPISDHMYFIGCAGNPHAGWSGSSGVSEVGGEGCKCGVLGTCTDPTKKCNCDIEDGVTRTEGDFTHNGRAGICEVCTQIDSVTPPSTPPPDATREVTITLGLLECAPEVIGLVFTCQDERNQGITDNCTTLQLVSFDPMPVTCEIDPDIPVSATVFKPENDTIVVPPPGVDLIIDYCSYSLSTIRDIVDSHVYCLQEFYVECDDSPLDTNLDFVFGSDGTPLSAWPGSIGPGCDGGCNCNNGGHQFDGGIVRDKNLLPITRIQFQPSSGTKTVHVGYLKCYKVFKDCHEIQLQGQAANPDGDSTYGIDPDVSGPEEIFKVECIFDNNCATTLVRFDGGLHELTQTKPADGLETTFTLPYETVGSVTQMAGLIAISEHCVQRTTYECSKSPIINWPNLLQSTYEYGISQNQSDMWGIESVVIPSDAKGCTCLAVGSCIAQNYTCNCDSGADTVDHAFVYHKQRLPIVSLVFNIGQETPATGTSTVTGLYCGPTPCGFPATCKDAVSMGLALGPIAIAPQKVDPFLVDCIENEDGVVITVVHPVTEDPVPIEFGNTGIVEYKAGVTDEQLRALVSVSNGGCAQPAKVICIYMSFLDHDLSYYSKHTEDNRKCKFFGGGRKDQHECICAITKECGGSEMDESVLENRKCSCDAGDGIWRSDAGTITDKRHIPMREYFFDSQDNANATGLMRVGPIFCAKDRFDINECEINFHDCHANADCENHPFKQPAFTCTCRVGFNGLGTANIANGRQCPDDDECALSVCSANSECINTYGSFQCICDEGYELAPGSETQCIDIDECDTNTHDCENAICVNTIGSFKCRCLGGFVPKNGTCEKIGVCGAFGDPHIMTYDFKEVAFQGDCTYLLSKDGCDDDNTTTFLVTGTFWDQGLDGLYGPVTYVEAITIYYKDDILELGQSGTMKLNTVLVQNLAAANGMVIQKIGIEVTVTLDNGVIIFWDGTLYASVTLPAHFMSEVCGLCGNFNGDVMDDCIVGYACPGSEGNITNSDVLLGESWTHGDSCTPNCTETNGTTCPQEKEGAARTVCDRIFESDDYEDCIASLNPVLTNGLLQACVFDFCLTGDESLLCTIVEVLMSHCTHLDIDITEFCPCDEDHKEYKLCPQPVEKATCLDLLLGTVFDVIDPLVGPCDPGCYCEDGYVFDGNLCVRPDDCGCLYGGVYYSEGTVIVTSNCTSKGICTPDGDFDFEDITCDENAVCENRDGIIDCYCLDGFYGNGTSCSRDGGFGPWSEWSTCTVSCENGTSSRTRECDSPTPVNQGQDCIGERDQTRICNEGPCPVDGGWSTWSPWGTCTETCATGTQTRNRDCTRPSPQHDGDECVGDDTDTQDCNTQPCPVDGGWSTWSPWGTCTETCATGIQTRNRDCTRPSPQHDGDECVGDDTDTQDCNTQPCPVDGGWSTWSPWGTCTETCATGTQTRNRDCTRPSPQHDGDECVGDDTDTQDCNTQPCPVDGGWSTWSPWGTCTETCATGTQTRNRDCTRPSPQHDGDECVGDDTDTQDCNTQPCPVDGGWSTWSPWGTCTETCATGTQTRNRDCTRPSPQHDGDECVGDDTDTQDCNTQPCPVDGGWSTWSPWGTCTETCATGTQTRNRDCTRPSPQHDGDECVGDDTDTQDCNTQPCPVDGGWSTWSPWGTCTETCATGTQTRNRDCTRPSPQHDGDECVGDDTDTQDCNTQPCPVDGGWSTWSPWGTCTETCATGTQTRNRDCTRPSPQHDGDECVGDDTDTQDCNTQPCPVDGGWSTWSPWGTCTETCATGTQTRNRDCTRPSPQHDGDECVGDDTDTQDCNTQPCPVDGGWSTWSPWGTCTETCATGTQTRNRDCTRPSPQHDGDECVGDDTDTQDCNTQPCPVDGGWSTWSPWGTCTETCATGTQTRNRDCTRPSPQHDGDECVGDDTDTQDCNTQPCPVDGGWSTWSPWGTCTETCATGTQTRNRDCTRPSPQHDGDECVGDDTDTQDCNTQPCPVDGGWSTWSPWGTCTETCATGTQTRNRDCTRPSPQHDGDECVGDDTDTQDCNTQPCPVDGGWSTWSPWGTCTETCATGTQTRNRDCTRPSPQHDGDECVGDDTDTQDCNTQPCPVDGGWSTWSPWGTCTETCATGTQTRNRDCTRPSPQHDGDECVGDDTDTQDCNTQPCPVDGGWSTWSPWGTCTETCATGTQTRNRDCTRPSPQHDGDECVGDDTDTQDCNTQPCPVDGGWSTWSPWGTCTETCATGTQTRNRDCTRPSPQHDGDECVGDDTDTQDCNTQPCPVDGGWSTWSPWGTCTETCATGTQTRNRDCTRPSPQHDGDECVGDDTDTQDCNTQPCPVDGGWSTWSPWGTCTETCATGTQTRNRDCTRPSPQHDGDECVGDDTDTQDCNTQPCPVDGGWSTWSPWGTCTETCATGTQTRNRDCTRPSPQHDGDECVGDDTDTQDCNTQPCPVDGGWSTWSPWGTCTETCATGTQTRNRDCTRPSPQHDGDECVGDDTDTQDCNTQPCPVDGGWSTWSPWGTCTETCATGTQTRNRDCTRPSPQHDGDECVGDDTDTQDCNTQPCPVDGGWSTWSPWGTCTETCATGTQTRNRDCTRPSPQHDGDECVGDDTDTQDCNTQPCPVDGEWGSWGEWGDCSKTCGPGTRMRTRPCDSPAPAYEGEYCPGSPKDTEACFCQECPDDNRPKNECEDAYINGTDLCGNNSRCIDTKGGFKCSCCKGYKWSKTTGQCVANRPNKNEDIPCCGDCQYDDCNRTGEVCAEDGTTYSSVYELVLDRCLRGYSPKEEHDIRHYGPCEETCANTTVCTKTYLTCKDTDNGPECICECTQEDNDNNPGPVCSTGNVLYDTYCEFVEAQCELELELIQAETLEDCPDENETNETTFVGPWSSWSTCSKTCGNKGKETRRRQELQPLNAEMERLYPLEETRKCPRPPCIKHPKPVTPWTPWSDCSVTCGKGSKMRTREPTRELTDKEKRKIELTRKAACYSPPCPGCPCIQCEGAEICNVVDGLPKCSCRYCVNDKSDPICGYITGGRTKNYKSLCMLQRTACRKGTGYGVVEDGPCSVDGGYGPWSDWSTCTVTCGGGTQTHSRECDSPAPANGGEDCQGDASETRPCNTQPCTDCEAVEQEGYITIVEDGMTFTSIATHQYLACMGGCPGNKHCKPSGTEERLIDFGCAAGSTIERLVALPTSCCCSSTTRR